MKKSISLMGLLWLLGTPLSAQENSEKSIFANHTHNVSLGYDFGNLARTRPEFGPMHLKYEHRLFGRFGVGGAFYVHSDRDNSFREDWSYPNGQTGSYRSERFIRGFALIPKVSWHFLANETKSVKLEKWDIYVSLGAGYGFERVTKDYTFGENIDASTVFIYNDSDEKKHFIATEINLGARFYPIENFGVYFEMGHGISFAQVGLIYTW
ncbi:MAG: hypothetical protein ACFHU9_09445 [Fluviicola sp.]